MQQFLKDLQKIYNKLQEQNGSFQDWFTLLKDKNHPSKEIINPLLQKAGLENTSDNTMAMLLRVVNLRDDSLDQVLKKSGFSEDEIVEKKELIYLEVANIHLQKHQDLIEWIEEQSLLTPFYRELIKGVHAVGKVMSDWQSSWSAHIINGVNKELLELFDGDEGKVIDMLHQKALLDRCDDEISDRCYSVLGKKDGEYIRVSYAQAFECEVQRAALELQDMIENLDQYEDEIYGQKKQWLEYLEAIKEALEHTEVDELVSYWAEVDKKWMAVTTPIQIGHPLEYYEDHFRKAVALEWDLRIINPSLLEDNSLKVDIKKTALTIFDNDITQRNLRQIDKVKLYIGQPMLYYGAEFNGLFSAQVVPNDENVSNLYGKKIFAFADFVLQSQRAKPTLKITQELFGKSYIQKRKDFLNSCEELWHKVYNITTIGHEYGHILWIDSDSESKMNKSGQFKNIEEFKATCGGLVSFFYNEQNDLIEHIVDDTISRAVGLMAWKEVGEVRPYYVEGLLHLHLLFKSKVLLFDGKSLKIDYSKYEQMKLLYIQVYEALAKHYIDKKDAKEFLEQFVEVQNEYTPKNAKVKGFVEYHWQLFKEYGQKVIL